MMKTAEDPAAPAEFFASEYRLDYTIHCFPKPVIAIGHGVVMGGGLGIFSACRYRLVTPDVTLAMPEITIGLFPDVGASWFLNRLPGRVPVALSRNNQKSLTNRSNSSDQ